MKAQEQHFWESHRKIAEMNELFLDFVNDGMTRNDLEKLIERRPNLWKKWEDWLDKLPKE